MAISFQGAGSVWVAVLAAVNLNKFLLEIEITQNLFASKVAQTAHCSYEFCVCTNYGVCTFDPVL